MANAIDGVSGLSPEFQKVFQATAQAERKPIQRIADRKGNVEAKMKLVDDLVGKVEGAKKLLPDLNNATMLRELAVSSSNDKVLVGSAERGKAGLGSWDIEVMSLASKTSAVSNTFEDKNEMRIGSGYFKVDMPNGDSKEIFIDEPNSTLEGMAKVINQARIGVHAAAVRDRTDEDAPYRLLITADSIGEDNNVDFPEFYFVGGDEDFYIDNVRPAKNALLRFEGQEIESPTNQLKDLIAGVTVNLKGTSEGHSTTLQIGQDTPKISEKLKNMVEKVNEVLSFIQGQNKMDQNTDTKKTLGGDYSVRMAEHRIYTALKQNLGFKEEKEFRSLTDIGILFQKNGTLALDQKKLEAALDRDFEGIAELLCGNGYNTGVINSLSRALNSISGNSNSMLTLERKGMQDNMNRMQKQIDDKEQQFEKKSQNLKLKLARSQEALSTLKSQSAQLGAIGAGGPPGMGG